MWPPSHGPRAAGLQYGMDPGCEWAHGGGGGRGFTDDVKTEPLKLSRVFSVAEDENKAANSLVP